ncbi:hypothetical protein QM012_004546 [Aureobasidium pullulans]|uniref:Uncharacterized protein n=1 Tax=Aureobasidium pullulans TaxID=5580 RepID=A0ABR0TUG9_AURPU
MKFTATVLTLFGATSLAAAAAPLDVIPPRLGPDGLAKRSPFGCSWTSWRCAMVEGAYCGEMHSQDCYVKCMTDRGCPVPPDPPEVETLEKRDSRVHCGMRNFECESQVELADSSANITEIYHNCMAERGCKIPTSLIIDTTEILTKRWHPHCGAWQKTKCAMKAESPEKWGDEDAIVDEDWRACMIDHNCQCAIDYPYYCDSTNS